MIRAPHGLHRVRKVITWRWMSIRAQVRNDRNMARWKRGQRIAIPVGDRLPVILCTWRRLDRLGHTLKLLSAQNIPVQALIWNNSPERSQVDAAVAAAAIPVSVHHSTRNIGGFGRFYSAREAAEAGHDRVVFIDDDQDFGPEAIGDLMRHHRPLSLSGWFAFTSPRADGAAWAAPGQAARYVGTGGMIADAAVFRDSRLFRCPRRFWFVEDYWLCAFAGHIAGYGIFRSPAQFEIIDDGRDQCYSLGVVKRRFMRYLSRHNLDL